MINSILKNMLKDPIVKDSRVGVAIKEIYYEGYIICIKNNVLELIGTDKYENTNIYIPIEKIVAIEFYIDYDGCDEYRILKDFLINIINLLKNIDCKNDNFLKYTINELKDFENKESIICFLLQYEYIAKLNIENIIKVFNKLTILYTHKCNKNNVIEGITFILNDYIESIMVNCDKKIYESYDKISNIFYKD